jgi:hypothetical protein
VFAEHFPGVDFKPSTYHDQRNFWLNVAPKSLKKFFEASRTSAGRWTAFTAAVRKHGASQLVDNFVDLTD